MPRQPTTVPFSKLNDAIAVQTPQWQALAAETRRRMTN